MVSWQQINVFFTLKLESLFGEITPFDSCLCLRREEVCAGFFGWLVCFSLQFVSW